MVKPAQLLQNLKYDSTMETSTTDVQDYLKKCGNQITSVVDGHHKLTQNVVTESYNNHSYNIHFMEINPEQCFSPSKQWNEMPYEKRNEKLIKIAKSISKYSKIFSDLEHTLRNIPSEQVLKYDIQMIEKYFAQCGNTCNKTVDNGDASIECISVEHLSLFLLGKIVSEWLAAGKSVAIVATEKVAVLAHAFGSMCLEAGIPKDVISIFLVQELHIDYFLKNVIHSWPYTNGKAFSSENGCTVVVAETGDIDSAIDMLVSEATCTYIYPWRVDRLLIQESVYEAFKKSLEYKFKIVSDVPDSLKNSIPRGAKLWQYPAKYKDSSPQYIVSDNVNLREKLNNVTTMQAYRSTKELMNLINNEPRFALSLWCDSVSVTNEISLAASVSNVWVNMYAAFDNLELNVHKMSVHKPLREGFDSACSKTKNLGSVLMTLKNSLLKWKMLNQDERLSAFLNHFKDIEQGLSKSEHEVFRTMKEKVQEISSKPHSRVKVIDNKLCVQTRVPVGIVFVAEIGFNELIEIIVSVIEGNGVIYVMPESGIVGQFVSYISSVPSIPIVISPDKDYDIVMIDKMHKIPSLIGEVKHINRYLYNTKSVWSPIGETFAN